jgi:hypothetical protein
MARESSDPDQVSYFAEAESGDGALPPAVDIVVGGPKEPAKEPLAPRTPTQADRNAERDRRAGEIASPAPLAPPTPPRAGPVAPDPRDDPSIELRRQLDVQRGATQRAENAAREAMARANQAESRAGQASVHMVGSAIEAATRASDQARAQFQACLDAGDHRGAADAQIALSDARANLLRLQEQKAILEEDAARPRPQPQPQPQQPQPFDSVAAMQNIINELTRTGYQRSAQWIRNHPEWVTSREKINEVDGAHSFATNNLKLTADTDAYFEKMEELLGMRQPVNANYRQPEARPPNPNARASAPANPGAPSYRTGETRQHTVHLTAEMREHAHNVLGMTDEEYAAELSRAYDEGKLLSVRLS